jgi:hypothetical protein
MMFFIATVVIGFSLKLWLDQSAYSAENVFDVIEKAHPVCLKRNATRKQQMFCLLMVIRNARLALSWCSHVDADADAAPILADLRRDAWRVLARATWNLTVTAFGFLGYSQYLLTHYQDLRDHAIELCAELHGLGGPCRSLENALLI